jgi:hypothetical protein
MPGVEVDHHSAPAQLLGLLLPGGRTILWLGHETSIMLSKLFPVLPEGAESLLAELLKERAVTTDGAAFDERVRWPAIQRFLDKHGLSGQRADG